MKNAPTKVFIADDHAVFRRGLVSLLEASADFKVVGEAGNGRDAIDQCLECKPDLAVFDVRMPTMDGIEAAKYLLDKLPSLKLVMLSISDLDDEVSQAVRAGAIGYINKAVDPGMLVEQLRAGSNGR